jgi:hypothetical protein
MQYPDRRHSAALLATLVGAVALVTVAAQSPATSAVNATRGIALDGYDVVAYFTAGKPAKGLPAHAHHWNGVTWHFVSAANREAFARAPEKFAPRFGGFCAYGISRGYAVDIDPTAWSIVDGRLYLNYSKSVQRTWEKDRATYIQRADTNWPAIAAKQSPQEDR